MPPSGRARIRWVKGEYTPEPEQPPADPIFLDDFADTTLAYYYTGPNQVHPNCEMSDPTWKAITFVQGMRALDGGSPNAMRITLHPGHQEGGPIGPGKQTCNLTRGHDQAGTGNRVSPSGTAYNVGVTEFHGVRMRAGSTFRSNANEVALWNYAAFAFGCVSIDTQSRVSPVPGNKYWLTVQAGYARFIRVGNPPDTESAIATGNWVPDGSGLPQWNYYPGGFVYPTTGTHFRIPLVDEQLGQWVEFIVEIKHATLSNGLVRVWYRNQATAVARGAFTQIFESLNIPTLQWGATLLYSPPRFVTSDGKISNGTNLGYQSSGEVLHGLYQQASDRLDEYHDIAQPVDIIMDHGIFCKASTFASVEYAMNHR